MYKNMEYWNRHQQKYPFQTDVPYRSEADVDPREMSKLIRGDFLRVPEPDIKITHWGFKSPQDLEFFQKLGQAERRA
jgi:hypothetical protein